MAAKFTKKKTTAKKSPKKSASDPGTYSPGWKPASGPGEYLSHLQCPLCACRGLAFIFDNVSSAIVRYGCDNCEQFFTAMTPLSPYARRTMSEGRDPAKETWDATIKPVIDDVFAAVVGALNKCADVYIADHGRADFHYGFSLGLRRAADLIRDAKV